MTRKTGAVHILYVEGNLPIRTYTTQMLDGQGHDVSAVAGASHALGILAAIGAMTDVLMPDLLMVDSDLGGDIDGWTLADIARGWHAAMPVIYCGAGCDCPDRRVADSLFLRKPCPGHQLERALSQLCRPNAFAGSAPAVPLPGGMRRIGGTTHPRRESLG